MHRLLTLIITLCAIVTTALSAYAAPSLSGRAGGEAPGVEATPPPVFYASMEQNDLWQTRASGFYSFAADGRGFKAVGQLSQKDITVTDGAVYHDGKVYYLRKTVESLFRYSLDWTVMDAETFEVESRTAKNGLTLAFDMTYDETTQTCFAASPRSYGEQHADLRRVDLKTGDFTTIAPLDVCIRAITADSKGQLWGLGNEVEGGRTVTFLYKINKENGALTRIGDVGYQMQETDAALTCDLRDDRIYWSASTYSDDEHLQRTYRRGLCELDTTTGRATFLWDYPGNAKMVGLFINTDHPAGFDDPTPLPVTDVTLTPVDGGRAARLSWAAPTQCVDRLTPLDPARLTYTVTRRNDGRIIASGLTECTCVDTPGFTMQRVGYTVTAVYDYEGSDFQSTSVQSPLCAIGQPHTIPYLQTFDSYAAFYTYTLVDANGDYNEWTGNGWFYDANAQAALYYTTLSRYADDWLITPLLDFDPTHAYRLRFGTYGYMGNGAQNTFEVALLSGFSGEGRSDALDPGQGVNAILRVFDDTYDTQPTSPAFNSSAQPRWCSVDIFPGREATLPGEVFDRIAFHNISAPDDHMFIDNIYVEDLGPADEYTPSDPDAPDADLDRFDDDVLRYVNDLRLASAKCSVLGSSAAEPSASATLASAAAAPSPSSELLWSPATTLPRLRPSVLDCESLEPFAIDGGEGWTTHDADGARTIGIGTNQGALEWPHTTEPQAFIVFNPKHLGFQSIIEPHSGDQCFVSFAAAGRASDDWLISPLLSGQKARFKFWAKCLYPECLNEQFEVWASYDSPTVPGSVLGSSADEPSPVAPLSSASPSAFKLSAPITVSSATEWTEYTFTLPEGVRYAMIRCVSDSQFGLMIDDITFPAAPAPTEFWGYNVYRDGQLIARELPTTTYAADLPGRYTVTAQYAEGESRHSNAVDVIIEGIDTVLAPAPAATERYDLQGRRVISVPAHGITVSAARKQLR